MIRFMSIASGSSGNCYYLGNGNKGILIDVGVPMLTINRALKAVGVQIEGHIMGVLITHDHADHIRTVTAVADKHKLPIYTTAKVHLGITNSRYVGSLNSANQRIVETNLPFELAGFEITPFTVPHDATDNVGYHITAPGFKFTLATDVGHITSDIQRYASMADYLIIEANYDREMLANGPYPQFLKDRVSGPSGHLSNQETGDFLAGVFHSKMKHIWLCHLSRDNNHPDLCWKSIENRLFKEGIRVGRDVMLTTLKRSSPSELYTLLEDSEPVVQLLEDSCLEKL